MPQKLTPEIVRAAIAGFELQKTQIDSQIAELRGLLDGSSRERSAALPFVAE
jgi:hypothetical protein